MNVKIEFTEKEIMTLAKKLNDAPPVKKIYNKQGAVLELTKEIREYIAKGYSWESAANFLTENGLTITKGTLKTYVNRAKITQQKNLDNSAEKEDTPRRVEDSVEPLTENKAEVHDRSNSKKRRQAKKADLIPDNTSFPTAEDTIDI